MRPFVVVALMSLVAVLPACGGKQPPTAPAAPQGAQTTPEPAPGDAQQPGLRVWAVDPTGRRPPELLLEQPRDLMLAGISPDGRYLLLVQALGQEKGDDTAVPYLFDRTTGTLNQGGQTAIRTAAWSGNGFYIDWLTHLDLQLKETHLDPLAGALHLQEGEREVISISFAVDSNRFVALVGPRWKPGEPVDLVQGNRDGTGLTVLPKAVYGTDTQMGTVAAIALSPDGQYAALTDRAGAALVRLSDPAPEQWVRVASSSFPIEWAPDSAHVWFGTGQILDLTGKPVLDTGAKYNLVWQPDGKGGVVSGYDGLHSFRLDDSTDDLQAPAASQARGFLPDGRLVVWRTVHPQ